MRSYAQPPSPKFVWSAPAAIIPIPVPSEFRASAHRTRAVVNQKGFIRRLLSSLHGRHLLQSVRVPLACHSKPWE
jgi:hypothetical protein